MSHSHLGFSITVCFLSAALDILTGCDEVPPLPSLLQLQLTLSLHHPFCSQTPHLRVFYLNTLVFACVLLQLGRPQLVQVLGGICLVAWSS